MSRVPLAMHLSTLKIKHPLKIEINLGLNLIISFKIILKLIIRLKPKFISIFKGFRLQQTVIDVRRYLTKNFGPCEMLID